MKDLKALLLKYSIQLSPDQWLGGECLGAYSAGQTTASEFSIQLFAQLNWALGKQRARSRLWAIWQGPNLLMSDINSGLCQQ